MEKCKIQIWKNNLRLQMRLQSCVRLPRRWHLETWVSWNKLVAFLHKIRYRHDSAKRWKGGRYNPTKGANFSLSIVYSPAKIKHSQLSLSWDCEKVSSDKAAKELISILRSPAKETALRAPGCPRPLHLPALPLRVPPLHLGRSSCEALFLWVLLQSCQKEDPIMSTSIAKLLAAPNATASSRSIAWRGRTFVTNRQLPSVSIIFAGLKKTGNFSNKVYNPAKLIVNT